MKKIIALTVLVAVLGAAGAYFLFFRPCSQAPPGTPSKLLPADTLLMVELLHLEKRINAFKNSLLAQKLQEINLVRLAEEFGAPRVVIDEFTDLKASVLSSLDSPLFRELFGRETVLAMIPIVSDQAEPEAPEQIYNNLLLFSRPQHSVDLVEFFAQFLTETPQSLTETYGSFEIKSFHLEEGIVVYYTFTDELMVASLSCSTLRSCLDLKTRSSGRLADNESYRTLRNSLERTERTTFIYGNIKALSNPLLRLAASKADHISSVPDFKKSLSHLKGWNDFGCSTYDDGTNLLQSTIFLTFDKTAMTPASAKALRFPPEKNKTLRMIPDSTQLYYWANTFDPAALWETYTQSPSGNNVYLNWLEDFIESRLGISLDTMFQAFDSQVAFLVADIDTDGFFPIPKLTLLFEQADNETLPDIIKSLIDASGITPHREVYRGTDITFIPLPLLQHVQPSSAFFNGFWVLSVNPDGVKAVIDTYDSQKGLAANHHFSRMDCGLTANNNIITFVEINQLIDNTKNIITWANKRIPPNDRETAHKNAIIISELITPLLDGLRMYQAIGTRTVIGEDEIRSDIYCKIER
ncbi:MAG: hypothetical protein JXD19_07120 [Deltaproteobacteria bacterium]|nr:hypothetical protein [Deltaproteobacteria bacterium]